MKCLTDLIKFIDCYHFFCVTGLPYNGSYSLTSQCRKAGSRGKLRATRVDDSFVTKMLCYRITQIQRAFTRRPRRQTPKQNHRFIPDVNDHAPSVDEMR